MNLLNSGGNWLLISIQELKTILKKWFQKQNEFTTEFESTRAIIPKQLFAFILKQLFARTRLSLWGYLTIFTEPEANNYQI